MSDGKKKNGKMIKAPEIGGSRGFWLRQQALLVYTTDPRSLTVDALGKLPQFAHVPRKTLKVWADVDQWTKERQRVSRQWREAIEAKLGSELAIQAAEQLRDLQDIRRIAVTKLKGTALEAKSWEGVLKVLLAADERLEVLARNFARDLNPTGGEESEPEVKTNLTVTELEAAVSAILADRRTQRERGEEDGRRLDEAKRREPEPDGDV